MADSGQQDANLTVVLKSAQDLAQINRTIIDDTLTTKMAASLVAAQVFIQLDFNMRTLDIRMLLKRECNQEQIAAT